MARIKPVSLENATEEAKEIFENFLEQRGNVPNMFRTLAHRPKILETAYEHFSTILQTGTVDIKLKEMVAVRVSQLNDCGY
ncbi:carboxymuconolactone decarboxylase family protein [Alkaliphilus metalliredigens]|nr:carboxymuconolactone decarboxylase family protein [Alkaliphilus metalliredigens]